MISEQKHRSPADRESELSMLRMICALWGEYVTTLGWPVASGFHTCELCGLFRASGKVAVPTNSVLFVAPEMVLHYVEQHSYRPPRDFVDAVLSCPLPGSPEYVRAVSRF